MTSTRRMEVLGQFELFTDQNTRDYLAWTIGSEDPMYVVSIPHRIPRALETVMVKQEEVAETRITATE